MSGSVQALRDLHPEDAAGVVNQLVSQMVDIVLGYGGRVDHFLGDGVLAAFGCVHAHENDPERAVLAALEIREAARLQGLEVTAGINTGEAYVGGLGSNQYQVLSVIGHAVNLAARLQGKARPGQILVGESTYRQTRRAFSFSPFELEVKGVDRPVVAYGVNAPLPRREKVRGIDGLGTGLIGRDVELQALRNALGRMLRGQGQVVSLIGDAGLGKSRLVYELRQATSTLTGEPLWLEGRCLELETAVGYGPVIDMLREYLGWRRDEPETTRVTRLHAVLEKLTQNGVLPAERAPDLALFLGHLLGARPLPEGEAVLAQLSPEQLRNQTFQALREFFVALSRAQPLVLVLEDLHWADSLSLELIKFLMEGVETTPLMLLCVHRPGRETGYSRLGETARRRCPAQYTEIVLRELTQDQSQQLLEELLTVDNLPETLKDRVLEKSRGYPFYVEEVVRSLVDSGAVYRDGDRWLARPEVEEVAVPESVQAVILTRLDRLDRSLKQVLQHAAIIGRVFRPRLLAALDLNGTSLSEALLALEDGQFILHERSFPEEEYSFKHVITRDTIYETLSRRFRARLHQRVAEAIEGLYTGSLEECYEELAGHYVQSGYSPKAIEYLLKAGEKALALYANREAKEYFIRALELLDAEPKESRDPEAQVRAREGLGNVLFLLGAHHEAELVFQQALAAHPRTGGEANRQARLTAKLCDCIHWQGRPDEAVAIAEQELARLGELRADIETANLLEVVMRSYWARDNLEAAGRYAAQLEALLPDLPYFDALYGMYYALAWLELRNGNFERSEWWLREMERVCRENRSENGLARSYHGMGDLARTRKDHEAAVGWFEQSLTYCERTGDAHLLMEGNLELACSLIHLEASAERVEVHLRRGMDLVAAMTAAGHGVSSVQGLMEMLGNAYMRTGQRERAVQCIRQAFQYGPHPAPDRPLRKLETLYTELDRHPEFLEFCAEIQGQAAKEYALQVWHLTPARPTSVEAVPTFSGFFAGEALAPDWTWVGSPDSDTWHRTFEDALELSAGPHGGPFPRLTLAANGEFVADTVLDAPGTDDCFAAGLVVWAGDGEYVLFGRCQNIQNELGLSACRDGQSTLLGRGWLPDARIRLRVECRSATIRTLCTTGDDRWFTCGEASLSPGRPLQVGLYTAGPGAGKGSLACFREFCLWTPE